MNSMQFPDVGGVDFNFDFDADLFDVSVGDGDGLDARRYSKPRAAVTRTVSYKNARKLASEIDLNVGFREFIFVPGNFIFGDLIEAMTELDKWRIDKMTIQTLSMSQENIDGLANVITMDRPSELRIILSDYWYAHEADRRTGLLWEIYDKLDIGDGFRLAFCNTHAKVVTVLTKAGHKVVIHGSANMRSSNSIEQFVIENDPDIYDYCESFADGILDAYDVVNHGTKTRKHRLGKQVGFEKGKERADDGRRGVRH